MSKDVVFGCMQVDDVTWIGISNTDLSKKGSNPLHRTTAYLIRNMKIVQTIQLDHKFQNVAMTKKKTRFYLSCSYNNGIEDIFYHCYFLVTGEKMSHTKAEEIKANIRLTDLSLVTDVVYNSSDTEINISYNDFDKTFRLIR